MGVVTLSNMENDHEESFINDNSALEPDNESERVEEDVNNNEEEESRDLVEAYSPIDSPETASENQPTCSLPEQENEPDAPVNRKRSLDVVSDEEELISEKRPRVDNGMPIYVLIITRACPHGHC